MTDGEKKDANARDRLQAIARMVDEEIPEDWGFMLFVFPFGKSDGRLNYVGKCSRQDAIRITQEWLAAQQRGESL